MMEMSAGMMAEMGRALTDTTRASRSSQHKGEVLRNDPDGTIWVRLFGGSEQTPVKESTVQAVPGMVVSVTIADGKATITGSTSAPSISAEKVNELMVPIADAAQRAEGAASAAEMAATSASRAANEANRLLDGVEEVAEQAQKTVAQILSDANVAGDNAAQAVHDAAVALGAANNALASAADANTAAAGAIAGLGTVEDVVDVVRWLSEHAVPTHDSEFAGGKKYYDMIDNSLSLVDNEERAERYAQIVDDAVVDGKAYYTRSGQGTEEDPYVYAAATMPDPADLASLYELVEGEYVPTEDTAYVFGKAYYALESGEYSVAVELDASEYYDRGNPTSQGLYELDDTVRNYLASHIAMTDEGLMLSADDTGYHVRLGATGMQVIDPYGKVVGIHGETIQLGSTDGVYLEITNSILAFKTGSQRMAYFGLNENGIWEMHIANTYVDDMLRFGDYAWVKRSNGNMTIKWLGE